MSNVITYTPTQKISNLIYSNNVSPLLALTTLKVLDLRGNELRSGSVTKVISHLQSLEKIFLIGNPLCADIVYYPNAIFEAQPQLFAVDNW